MICIDEPIDISGFEKEISKQIPAMSKMIETSHDIEELVIDALKRRCNDRKTMMHAHLRLKNGANVKEYTMHWNELADLSEMIAAKGAVNEINKRLAKFYVRIAALCNRVKDVQRCFPPIKAEETQLMHDSSNHKLVSAYSKNEETMNEKHQRNHNELNQIMAKLFLGLEIHPELTENDLHALETQVECIAERGCAVQELRRLKIKEALLEENQFNKLMQELTTLTQ